MQRSLRSGTLLQQPQLAPLGKFFGKVSKDVGEDFALASLGPSNARQPDPLLGRRRLSWDGQRQSRLQIGEIKIA